MSTVRVRGATRGVARKQEVALGAATASGGEARLGQIAGGVVRRGGGQPQGGSGAGRCTAHGRQSSGGSAQRNRGGGREVDEGDWIAISRKDRDLTVMLR
jgi:hypothetical protein